MTYFTHNLIQNRFGFGIINQDFNIKLQSRDFFGRLVYTQGNM